MKTDIRVFFSLSLLVLGTHVVAQQTVAPVDTLTASLPTIDYAIPSGDLTIANIAIVGSETYEDYVLIGFSGLSVGQKIKVPGTEISSAVKRFWKQGYFSDVRVLATKIQNDSIWLELHLKQRPRISKVNYYGLKKSEEEDLQTKLALTKGSQITPDLLDRSKIAIKKEMAGKGYYNAEVFMYEKADPAQVGSVILDVNVDKKEKIKVREIYVTGNQALSLNKIDATMKKTNRQANI